MCVRAQVYVCSITTIVVAAPHRSSYYNNFEIVFIITLPLYSFLAELCSQKPPAILCTFFAIFFA